MKTVSHSDLAIFAARFENVNGYGSMSGRRRDSGDTSSYEGWMPRGWAEIYRDEYRAGEIDYVIYSRSTPIAWHGPKGWTIPRVSYSASTGKQLGHLYRIDAWRTRIDKVSITKLTELNSSSNGGPRYQLVLSDGRITITKSDTSLSYDIRNLYSDQTEFFPNYTPAGRLESIERITK